MIFTLVCIRRDQRVVAVWTLFNDAVFVDSAEDLTKLVFGDRIALYSSARLFQPGVVCLTETEHAG